jgi:uncharacterized OsmC-like protein
MTSLGRVGIQIERVSAYEFRVRFDNERHAHLTMDEPAPLGKDAGPNAARVLAAAIGNCLSASLVFCLSKRGAPVKRLSTDVSFEIVRNEHKRLRVGKVDVVLKPELDPGDQTALDACLSTFEDFCMVTQSVREGLDVSVQVTPVAHTQGEAR